MLLIGFIIPRSRPQSPVVPGSPPSVPRSPLPSPAISHAKMSYLVGPAVLHNDGRPEVSRTGVDRILPSRPVQGSWQSPRRALRGPRTVANTVGSKNVTFSNPNLVLLA
jgi:hypothetical protein